MSRRRVAVLRDHLHRQPVSASNSFHQCLTDEFAKGFLSLRRVTEDTGKAEFIVVEEEGLGVLFKKQVFTPSRPELVPQGFCEKFRDKDVQSGETFSQYFLQCVAFLVKKDELEQDVFLIGSPGKTRRNLVLAYCELLRREVEFVSVSQDTTVSDIKQRRDIISGSAVFVDGPAVRAARLGRILILEGIEKAERNVLSVLNNLLENREMHLEDGRFLVNPSRFDGFSEALALSDFETRDRLVPVSRGFRVVALGLPVPEYDGVTLDPPFRSRFQAKCVEPISPKSRELRVLEDIRNSLLAAEYHGVDGLALRALRKGEFPAELDVAQKMLRSYPDLPPRFVFGCVFPFTTLPWSDALHKQLLLDILIRHGVYPRNVAPQQDTLLSRLTSSIHVDAETGRRRSFREQREEALRREDVGLGSRHGHVRNELLGSQYSASCGYQLVDGELVSRKRGDEAQLLGLSLPADAKRPGFVDIPYHREILTQMLLLHSCGLDMTLLGGRGCGKSALARQFAQVAGLELFYFPLHRDMTAQDLFQRRTTLPNGDTVWLPSPLTTACLYGGVLVLDGLEQVSPGTLGTLGSLLADRFVSLPNGTRLVRGVTKTQAAPSGGLPSKVDDAALAFEIHGACRIVGVARPSAGPQAGIRHTWLTPEVNVTFMPFLFVRDLDVEEEFTVLRRLVSSKSVPLPSMTRSAVPREFSSRFAKRIRVLLEFTQRLRLRNDDEAKSLSSAFSTRQLLRISKRLFSFPDTSLVASVQNACLWQFLPPLARNTLLEEMKKLELGAGHDAAAASPSKTQKLEISVELFGPEPQEAPSSSTVGRGKERPVIGHLEVGDVKVGIRLPSNPLLVPSVTFFDNPRHTSLLRDIVMDFSLGEHILLIGNQGVGKNKLADRFLELMKLPREYIQLNRDTTVNHLTSQPVVKDGVVTYEDSQLVKAARHGYVLVIDEADKAPTHVTVVLKSLLVDGEMLLSDGRRIRHPRNAPKSAGDSSTIPLHSDFRVIVLANRPGFPFLGNDFFREVGDIFACHVVDNPDEESELVLLSKYAPEVPLKTLQRLCVAFQELRSLVDEGSVKYPYSTRELVNIVRHLQEYPDDGIATTLQNVFDFDQYQADEKEHIRGLFQRHGIPIGMDVPAQEKSANVFPLPASLLTEKWVPSKASTRCTFAVEAFSWRKNTVHHVGEQGYRGDELEFPLAVRIEPGVRLHRISGRSAVFDERVFTFHLPLSTQLSGPSSGVLDMARIGSGSLVIVANDSFHNLCLYTIDPEFRSYDKYDMYLPHFNFNDSVIRTVRRPAPARCALAPFRGNRVCMYVHDEAHLLVLDLAKRTQRILRIPVHLLHETLGEKPKSRNLWTDRQAVKMLGALSLSDGILIFYREGSESLLLINMAFETVHSACLGFAVHEVELLSRHLLLVKGKADIETAAQRIGLLYLRGDTVSSPATARFMASRAPGSCEDLAELVAPGDSLDDAYSRETIRLESLAFQEIQRDVSMMSRSGSSNLYADHCYISPERTTTDQVPVSKGHTGDRRFMYSKGTIAQILQGIEGFVRGPLHSDEVRNSTNAGAIGEATVRTYLRTRSTAFASSISSEFVASIKTLSAGSLLCVALLKAPDRGAAKQPSTYMGFSRNSVVEIVDVERQELRQIRMQLPDTSNRAAMSMMFKMTRSSEDFFEEIDEADEGASQAAGYDTFIPAKEGSEDDDGNPTGPFLRQLLFTAELENGDLVVVDRTGIGQVFEVEATKLAKSLEDWKKFSGSRAWHAELDLELKSDEVSPSVEDELLEEELLGPEDDGLEVFEAHGELNSLDESGAPVGEGEFVLVRGSRARRSRAERRIARIASVVSESAEASSTQRLGGARRVRTRNQGRGGPRGSRRGRGPGQAGQGGTGGRGSGGPRGSGSGGGGSGGSDSFQRGVNVPEPGQHRRRHALSAEQRQELHRRINDVKEMLRLFPHEPRLLEELDSLEQRLRESDASAASAASGAYEALSETLSRLSDRLSEVLRRLREDPTDVRLRAEEQVLRSRIANLQETARRTLEQQGSTKTARSTEMSREGTRLSKEAKAVARELSKEAWQSALRDLELNPQDVQIYLRYKEAVRGEIRELRSTLNEMHAKQNERVWLRNKDAGDLDERRLIDGLTGDRNVYKRRGEKPPDPYSFQSLPKRLVFVFDVSSSMAHYAADGRLERTLEAATMIMESFQNFDHKFRYKFRGHSGSVDDLVFVEEPKYPGNDLQKLNVLRAMNTHAESCGSGDNTLDAARLAIRELSGLPADESFVVLLSDANLEQYDITPSDLRGLLAMDERVNVFILFIGSMGEQAHRLRSELPNDRVFVTLQTSEIPKVLKRVFLSSVLKA